MISIKKPCLVLCDIEGTTTSISFVKDNLFPYVRQNVKAYLKENINNEQTLLNIKLLWDQYEIDKDQHSDLPEIVSFENIDSTDQETENAQIDSVVNYVNWQMNYDKKTTSLKQLQGHIWKDGYQTGKILGHIYDDVPAKFKEYVDDYSILLGIYSSGSVFSQKLLFAHTLYGDMTKFISYYFDTNVGAKQEVSSYQKIVNLVNLEAHEILFLTDIPKEAKAATEAGLVSVLLEREGTRFTEQEKEDYLHVKNLNEINFI